uniref:DNA/RNA-binding protein Alba-like domain-containing protein n=1 Tax=Leersia perrieri TaxID=77586 RepID=A0A0D9UXD4_9ORYZ
MAVEEITEGVRNLAVEGDAPPAAAAGGGGEGAQRRAAGSSSNRIQVSNTKKPLFFYVNLAKRYMQQHGDVELSALGMAIATVVTVAEILKNNGFAVEKSVCNLCNGGVRFVREHDPNRSIRYIPLQSESGRKLLQRSGRAPDDISSVVLVEKDRSYIKSEAVLRIMEYLNLPFPQLAIFFKFVPLFMRDFAYDNVADNRYTFFGRSESESCEIL